MSVTKELFGTKDGREIYRYFIENQKGMKVGVINFGAILTNVFVKDKDGRLRDVVLGYDTFEPYIPNIDYFGATVGPNANRTGGAAFTLDGVRYELEANNGENNLHSHSTEGYQMRIWDSEEGKDKVTFFLQDQDGSMGFPGNKKISVSYEVTPENDLVITYDAESDKNTIINMTNHSYFNLSGQDGEEVFKDHLLTLHASHYTPAAPGSIPTGEIASVKGTPFDFLEEKNMTEGLFSDHPQIQMAGGFDHNWVIDGYDGSKVREFAVVRSQTSGITMKASTDLPGVQFYAGNFVKPQEGKGGASYGPRKGMCLETQYYPDSANKPEFPSPVFGPDRKYHTVTIYSFS